MLLYLVVAFAFGEERRQTHQITMRFDHVSVDQGLSNFTPTCIAQDKQGFLWIGTEDGLNKYDGHTFRVYRPKHADSSSLDGGIIVGLMCDRDGDVWVTSQGDGLFRYDRESDAFQKFRLPVLTANIQFVSGNILQTRDGLIWITTNDGAYVFEKQSQTIRRAVHKSTHPSLTTSVMTCIAEDSSGRIWFGTSNGVNCFDPRKNTIAPYPFAPPDFKKPDYQSVSSLQVDHQGTVWATTIGGLLRLNQTNDSFETLPFTLANGHSISENICLSAYVDPHGKLWVGTMGDGLIEHDPATGMFRQILGDEGNAYSLLSNRVHSIFEDRSGVLWVGNYRAGLNRYIKRQSQFMVFRMQSFVYAMLEDRDGEVWFGTTDGLYRLRKPNVPPTLYTDRSATEFTLSSPQVEALAQDSSGDLWIGTGGGIDRLSKTTNRVKHYKLHRVATVPALGRMVKSLYVDRDGDIWVGVDQGVLFVYDRKKDSFRELIPKVRNAATADIPSVWCITQDREGILWFATFGAGLFCYDKRSSTLTQYMNNPKDSTSISRNALYFVRESAAGDLWIGSFGGGAICFDRKMQQFRNLTVENGLPDNFVKGMLEDAKGNLWFSTDKGLSKFEGVSQTFKNYREKDGLHTNVFLSGAFHKGASGRFYFGGQHGVTFFYPESLKGNVFAPSVVITNFKVLDRPTRPLGGFPSDLAVTISLSHDENFFSFEFVSTDYSAPDKNQFAYKLEGLDKEWIAAGTRRYASYTHIPSGDYLFKVKGTNSDGVWSSHIAAARVIVVPPLWERWWFRILATVLLVGAGIAVYNYRVNRLLEIERLRVRIASDLHDDIGSSLTRISLQSELIQEGIEPEEQQNYLKSIATMSRDLVTSMSDIVWSIDSRNDSVENILDKMRNFGTTVLSTKDVTFNLAQSGLEIKKKLSVDLRENLYLIYKEAINNIAKHANASSVNVVLRNDSDKFTMTIVDNGKGWEGKERPSGHGTKNMKMRAERLGGKVEFIRDEGTRVILSMKRL